jgi:hypothetical protein
MKFFKTNKMDKQTINEMEINGKVYVLKDSVKSNQPAVSCSGLKAVLIRSVHAGVHFGYLKSKEDTLAGRVVVLLKTRRVWYWKGAASLSQMAVDGVNCPNECKFTVELEENEITNVIEILPLTEKAFENLKSVKVWKM